MAGRSYKDLLVWQKAMDFVTDTYKITAHFPQNEMYGLSAQLRRAAVSIPSNIAEGQGRLFDREFAHFLSNALGSLMEVEIQLQIAFNLCYLKEQQHISLCSQAAEIGRLLNGLNAAIKRKAAAT